MSLYGCFDHSIAGLRAAEALLDQASRIIADPSQWSMDTPDEQVSYATFDEYIAEAVREGNSPLSHALSVKGATREGLGGPVAALKDLGVGMQMGPRDLLDAMIALIIAQRMYEANARVFAVQNRVVGIMIHLGEEGYRGE